MIHLLTLLFSLVFTDTIPHSAVINFDQGIEVNVDSYNQLLAEGYANHANWVENPASIVLHLTAIPPQEIQNGKPQVTYESINIALDRSIVLVIGVDDLLDDSLASVKFRFRLITLENKYQFTEIKVLMKCYFGHGYTHYSGQICN